MTNYINEFRELQGRIGAMNASKGFHGSHKVAQSGPEALQYYWSTKLFLIVSEATEALDELRAGHAVDEPYEVDGKPEGFPSELADVVIRSLDLAEEAGINLWDVIDEKLRFNDTRAHKHGKSF